MISVAEQIACVERELTMRRRVYARRVEAGTMRQTKMDYEIAAMEAVKASLEPLAAQERLL